jgi:hypothetical protein
MTLKGLFLDPRIWKIDYQSSPFWNPEKYGIEIDLHSNAFEIPETGIDKKYDFVIATEVWEIPIRKTLEFLRNKGLKVILVPREVAPGRSHHGTMFADPHFYHNGMYYFTPDIVLAPGQRYYDVWEGRAKREIIGYPRLDICLRPDLWRTRGEILKRHGLEDKKIVFFPSYPPYHVQTKEDGSTELIQLDDDLENTMVGLEEFAVNHKDEVQVVTKIHPSAQKCFNKKMGPGGEVAGTLKKYYKNPTPYMKVIGDVRNDSSIAREMIIIADVVVGYTSMMLLEAIVMNKPVVHLKFEQCRGLYQAMDFSEEIKTAYDKSEMIPAITEAINTDEYLIRESKLLEYCLHKVDGKFCERLCKEIKNVCGE